MLQRPHIKLPTRRLSHLSKTPSKKLCNDIETTNDDENNNENINNSNRSSTPLSLQIESNHIATPQLCTPQRNDAPSSAKFMQSHPVNTENIQCMVRIRPLLTDIESRGRICVDGDESMKTVSIDCKPKPKTFTFDHIGGIDSTQESIFQKVGKPISNACLSGYNGTIFAYGQTGSGKTFTLLGDFEQKNSVHRGLMPRVFDYIFSQIQRHRDKMGSDRVEYLVKCSCLEIYNERIQDLLEPDRCNLSVREDIRRGVIVDGLSYQVCETANDALNLINDAARNRRVSETSMNKESSRSHLMFSLVIECRITLHSDSETLSKPNKEVTNKMATPCFASKRMKRTGASSNGKLIKTRTSRFNLVDLAGSERQSKTNAKGERLREAGNINKSLTTLGHVMNALVHRNTDKNHSNYNHIHYRDSKLTHLLKDSLGGNSLTFMIACISPSSLNLLESLSTLQFASRAKYIKNKAELNEDQSGSLVVLKAENLKLLNEVQSLKNAMRKQQQSRKQSISTSFIGHKMEMDVDGDEHNENGVNEEEIIKMKDALEILERENYCVRRENQQSKKQMIELNKIIEKKSRFVMSLKMQLKLRQNETVKLRKAMDENVTNSETIRNEIIDRYEREEKERKTLLSDPSYLIEEHLKNMELQQQSEQMMDFFHRFIDEKDNKVRHDEYMKWKNAYSVLVDENEEIRQQKQSNPHQFVAEKNEEYETKIHLLTSEKEAMDQALKSKETELSVFKANMDKMENKHNDLLNNYAELESKIQLKERKYFMEREAMREEYEKQLSNLKMGAVKALDSNNEQNMELKMEIGQIKASLSATEKELMDSQSAHREQIKELQTMKNQMDDMNGHCEELKEKLSKETEKTSLLNTSINEKVEKISSLQQEIERILAADAEKAEVMKESQRLQQELEEQLGAKHSIVTRLEAELENISQQLSDFKLKHESLQDDHQILSDVQSTLEYQKLESDEKVESLTKEIEAYKTKMTGLNEEIQSKQSMINTLQKEASDTMLSKDEMVKHLNAKNENLLKTMDAMSAEMNSIKESLKISEEDGMKKGIDIDALKREIEIANGQLSDYKTSHNELEKKYTANIAAHKELKSDFKEIQRKSDHYNASLIDKNIHLQRLLEENEELKKEYDSFQNDAEAKMSHLGTEINKLQNEIREKNQIYDKESKEWKCSKEEIVRLHQKEIEDKNERIELVKKQMMNEINALKSKLSENESISAQKLKEANEKLEELQTAKIELLEKYENEQCKLNEKEKTLHLLQAQLSRFSLSNCNQNDKEIESQMNEVFETFNNEKTTLKQEVQNLVKEKEKLKSQLMEVSKENKAAKESFESHKQNMCQQLERAHADIQLRQERSERLIKTFEQRLELRQKQNVDYREKIDELSQSLTTKKAQITKQIAEINDLSHKLKRYQHSVSNAQSLNETLLTEKQAFDAKMEERDDEIKEITKKHNKLATDIAQCIKEREIAIKTSVRMRKAEEKAYNEMMEYKEKYNELEETSQRKLAEMADIRKQNEELCVENSKLAGHHNAQQRINHLLNLKKECEKLKKEKKVHLNKISLLQKKLKSSSNVLTNLDISSISNVSSMEMDSIKQQLTEMSASKEEMAQIMSKILNTIRNISHLSVIEEQLDFKVNGNNVDQHFVVLSTIQNVINDQSNRLIKLKRDVGGLQNDINIRDEKIKLLRDQNLKSPLIPNRTKQRNQKKNTQRAKSTTNKKDKSDSFTFE